MVGPPANQESAASVPDLGALIRLFHDDGAQVGKLELIAPDDVPEPARTLLVHEHHMTVTMESFHKSAVDVVVLKRNATPTHYAREILLVRKRDGVRVQYGIMRVALAYLNRQVRREIQDELQPLGRILIEHNVLRVVELCGLWRIAPGPAMKQHLPDPSVPHVFGRTAMIHCDGQPAVELFEVAL